MYLKASIMNTCNIAVVLLIFFSSACIISFLLLRSLLKSKITQYFCDKPDPRKVHSRPIPRLGGSVIVITFLALTGIFLLSSSLNLIPVKVPGNLCFSLIFSSLIIFISGLLDDSTFVTVRVRHKISAELLIGLGVVYFFNIHFREINILNYLSIPLWLSKLISVLWVVGLINALNMIDGIDGLAGGISIISMLALAVIGFLGKMEPVVITCFILTGAVLGFLTYNLPPARTFMGDTGSLFLGTMVGIISMYLGKEVTASRALLIMPLIASVPIIEVFVTMVRRYFKSKDRGMSIPRRLHSMVVPDNSHIHHRLVYLGFSHMETAVMLCVLSFTMCCGAISIYLLPKYAIAPTLVYLAIPVVFALDKLGFGGRFKKALHLSTTRYNGFKKRTFIGVVDSEGSTLHLLKKNGSSESVEYVSISDDELPSVSKHLRAVVVRKNDHNIQEHLSYAERASVLIKGPIFVVTPENASKVSFLEVYKNGTLNVKERKGSINDLIHELKNVKDGKKWKHKNDNHNENPALSAEVCKHHV